MAVGQQVLSAAEDLAVLDAAMLRLEVRELTRGAEHAALLREVLELQTVLVGTGMELAVVPQLALALSCSEARAGQLLAEAQALIVLPGAVEAVEAGLLTVEQSRTVIEQLKVLPLPDRVAVWRRLQTRLIGAADGLVQPPARLADLLRRWVIAQDREAAEQRRRQAQQDRRLEFRARADGLHDLFALAMNGPDRLTIGARIAARSMPWGSQDDRTADQRRFDAFRDLLLGRDQLPILPQDTPLDPHTDLHAAGVCTAGLRSAGAGPCGCLPGTPVPCGMDTMVILPIGAGLGTTDETAELVGHGPLEPDLTEQILLNAPRLRPVWVDENGVPVAVGEQTVQLGRGDPHAVREALLALQALPVPTERHPRHPLDHPCPSPDDHGRSADATVDFRTADLSAQRVALPAAHGRALRDDVVLATAALGGAHPAGSPGPYRVGRRLRRLLELRPPAASGPAAAPEPAAATPSTTARGPATTSADRPAPATSDPAADGTTGSSSSAGPRRAAATPSSPGPTSPADAGGHRARTSHRNPPCDPRRRSPARTPGTSSAPTSSTTSSTTSTCSPTTPAPGPPRRTSSPPTTTTGSPNASSATTSPGPSTSTTPTAGCRRANPSKPDLL